MIFLSTRLFSNCSIPLKVKNSREVYSFFFLKTIGLLYLNFYNIVNVCTLYRGFIFAVGILCIGDCGVNLWHDLIPALEYFLLGVGLFTGVSPVECRESVCRLKDICICISRYSTWYLVMREGYVSRPLALWWVDWFRYIPISLPYSHYAFGLLEKLSALYYYDERYTCS